MVLISTVAARQLLWPAWPFVWQSRIAGQIKTAAWNWLGQSITMVYRIDLPHATRSAYIMHADAWLMRAAMRLMPAELAIEGRERVEDLAKFLRLRKILTFLLHPKAQGFFYLQNFLNVEEAPVS